MPSNFSQAFPPAPPFTEKNVGNLKGKVFIVTGATSGVGFEVAKILYGRGGTVYIAARSLEKIKAAIRAIKTELPGTDGRLVALNLDLADLSTIKASAEEFLSKEDRLDVLVHNAGVMTPPAGSKSKLGHDLEMATNCLGPFLFNHHLEAILKQTAHSSPSESPSKVRIVWVASMISVSTAEGGIVFNKKTGNPEVLKNAMKNYMQSKVGNVFLASEAAKRFGGDGIISLVGPNLIDQSVNPGLMKTQLQRHGPALQGLIMGLVFKPPRFGAYSELFAGLSPSVRTEHNGSYVVPWGRFGEIPTHIERGLRNNSEGGNGAAERFWKWCERETEAYF